MNDDWQAAQHADECVLKKAARDALLASRTRTLTDEEIMAAAYCAGIANDVYKELRA